MSLERRAWNIFATIGFLLVGFALWGPAIVRRGFTCVVCHGNDGKGKLELAEMRSLNPKSPEEQEEEAAERRFLEGGQSPRSAPSTGHHHRRRAP